MNKVNEVTKVNKHAEKQFIIEQGLRDIYYSPSTGYQGVERLYQKAKESGLKVSKKLVKDWLKTQDTYTRYKPIIRKHKYQKTFVRDLGDQIQMDLVDMGKYKDKNKGFYWILTAVEILSRYAFTIPVYRKTTKYMTEAVSELLKKFNDRFGKYPNTAQFDDGKEFYNVGVKNLLESYNVKYFSTGSSRKAAVVERFNRTLKTSMWKYFYANGSYESVSALDDLTRNYNQTKHSVILMKPADVNKTNSEAVWITLFGYGIDEFPRPKFSLNETVRISKYKNIFEKGYEANFTEEIFKIVKIYRGDPNMYGLEDLTEGKGEPIIGRFYENELSAVDKKDDVYRVEKVLKRKKVKGEEMVLVKWLGYSNKHNSWVNKKYITAVNET